MTCEWNVVPLCEKQLLDVRSEDILNGGDFRKCSTYRGGGGYDRFPYICKNRWGIQAADQFVVQLWGCHLRCPYCYVTPAGIWGIPKKYSTENLIQAYIDSEQNVFHLMGGAPALWLNNWAELITQLFERVPNAVFHSDLTLTEQKYDLTILKQILRPRCLYVISIKGTNTFEYSQNTGLEYSTAVRHQNIFWENLTTIVKELNPKYFYVTYTNCRPQDIYMFKKTYKTHFGKYPWSNEFFKDCFSINLIAYNAIKQIENSMGKI